MELLTSFNISGVVASLISGSALGWSSLPHCISMCGPVQMSICMINRENYIKSISIFNAARILGYILIGFLSGTAGFYTHKIESLKMGEGGFHSGHGAFFPNLLPAILFIIMAFHGFKKKGILESGENKISGFINKYFMGSNFLLGIAASLLPCGMLYMAITIGFATMSPVLSMLFMLSFGFTVTVPLQLAVIAGKMNNRRFQPLIDRFFPYLSLGLAIIYILRYFLSHGK